MDAVEWVAVTAEVAATVLPPLLPVVVEVEIGVWVAWSGKVHGRGRLAMFRRSAEAMPGSNPFWVMMPKRNSSSPTGVSLGRASMASCCCLRRDLLSPRHSLTSAPRWYIFFSHEQMCKRVSRPKSAPAKGCRHNCGKINIFSSKIQEIRKSGNQTSLGCLGLFGGNDFDRRVAWGCGNGDSRRSGFRCFGFALFFGAGFRCGWCCKRGNCRWGCRSSCASGSLLLDGVAQAWAAVPARVPLKLHRCLLPVRKEWWKW